MTRLQIAEALAEWCRRCEAAGLVVKKEAPPWSRRTRALRAPLKVTPAPLSGRCETQTNIDAKTPRPR
jgi:hypothetical protein